MDIEFANRIGALAGVLIMPIILAAGIWGIIAFGRANKQRRRRLDPRFVGAPITSAVVLERNYLGIELNERYKYRMTYRVHLPNGAVFIGWEEKFLAWITERGELDPGTGVNVAYWPGQTNEVRAVTPTMTVPPTPAMGPPAGR